MAIAQPRLLNTAADTVGWRATDVIGLVLALGVVLWAADGGTADHLGLAICLLTSLGWLFLRVDAATVALAGALALALVGLSLSAGPSAPLAHLGDDITVLIIAAFVMAQAVARTGLAHSLAEVLLGRTPGWAYPRLVLAVMATTFLIPSTAARASVLVPLVEQANRRNKVPTAALMAPLVVVLGAFASPIAAGANLLAIQLLASQTGIELGFAEWVLLAAPLALTMAMLAAIVVWHQRADLQLAIDPHSPERTSEGAAAAQGRVLLVLALVASLWATTGWHGIEPMLVALIGAMLVSLPGIGVITLKEGLRGVDWTLIILLSAASFLSEAIAANPLISEFVAELTRHLQAFNQPGMQPAVLGSVALAAMLAHLVVSSRSARAALLLGPSLAIASAVDIDPAIMVLTIAAGTGFCVLTPAGSKALLVFAAGADTAAFRAGLIRAGLVLLPLQWVLTLGCALWLWPTLLKVG